MKLCHYGCGQEGQYPFTSFYGKRDGLMRCSKSAHSCPAMKKTKINASKLAMDTKRRTGVLQKATEKRRQTMSRIGNDGLTGFERASLNIAASRREDDGSYRGIDKTVKSKREKVVGGKDIFQLAAEKTAATRFGVYVGLEGKSDFECYRYQVIKVTNRQPLHLLENIEKRAGYGKSDDPYQLDHRFSIAHGFLNNVDPKIVGHISNLLMMPARANNSKGSRCDITLEELFRRYAAYQTPE